MNILNTVEILREVAGGLHLEHHHHHHHKDTEDKIKDVAEEVHDRTSNAVADLTGNEHHHRK